MDDGFQNPASAQGRLADRDRQRARHRQWQGDSGRSAARAAGGAARAHRCAGRDRRRPAPPTMSRRELARRSKPVLRARLKPDAGLARAAARQTRARLRRHRRSRAFLPHACAPAASRSRARAPSPIITRCRSDEIAALAAEAQREQPDAGDDGKGSGAAAHGREGVPDWAGIVPFAVTARIRRSGSAPAIDQRSSLQGARAAVRQAMIS